MTHAPTRHTPSASWRVRLGIWAMLVAVVISAFGLTGLQRDTTSSVAAKTAASSSLFAAPMTALPQTAPSSVNAAVPAADDDFRTKTLNEYYTGDGAKDALELLPAWRWKSTSGFYENAGKWNIGAKVLSVLGSVLFLLSSFVWGLLLGILKFALTLDLVNTAATAINVGFAGLTKTIWASGIVWFIALVVLITVVKMAAKGKFASGFALILMLVIPVGTMQGLFSFASQSSEGGTASPSGSPSWIAQQGVGILDSVGAGLGSGFGLLSGMSLGSEAASSTNPNCGTYMQALYAEYDKHTTNPRTQSGKFTQDVQKQLDGAQSRLGGQAATVNTRSTSSVATVSYLWERAYLTSWTEAQFGTGADPARMACHKLEDSADVDPYEQLAVAKAANAIKANSYPGVGAKDAWKAFDSKSGRDHERQMFAWGACAYDGNKWIGASDAWNKASGGNDLGTKCGEWVTGKASPIDAFDWKDDGKVRDATKLDGVDDAGTRERLLDVRNVALTFKGYSPSIRLVNGLLSVATSGIYLYALGGLAIGAIIAQLGLVLLLILLPATLLMLAMPGGIQGSAGKKLLRLTGAFMLSKLVFTVVLVLLLQAIMVFEFLVSGMAVGASGGGSTFNGLLHALIPLAALFLIRMLLKNMGLGNITSVGGALGMQTSAALKASGDSNGNGGWKSGSSAGFNNAMTSSSARRSISNITNGGRKVIGAPSSIKNRAGDIKSRAAALRDKATSAAIKADQGLFGGAGNLENRFALLHGKKDANGNTLEMSMGERTRQRMAMLGMAGAGALLAKAPNTALTRGMKESLGMRYSQSANHRSLMDQRRSERKMDLANTKGMTGLERAEYYKNKEINALEAQSAHAMRMGVNDRVVSDEQGNVLLERRDDQGNLIERITPGATFSLDEQRAAADAAKAVFGVNDSQIISSSFAVDAVVAPQLSNGSGRVSLPRSETVEGQINIAQSAVNYLPDSQKITPPDFDENMKGMYYNLMLNAAGGIDLKSGAIVDFALAGGVDLNTDFGKAELEKAMSGKGSSLDGIVAEVSAERHRAIISAVRDMASMEDNGRTSIARVQQEVRLDSVNAAVESALKSESIVKDSFKSFGSAAAEVVNLTIKPGVTETELRDAIFETLNRSQAVTTNALVCHRESSDSLRTVRLVGEEGASASILAEADRYDQKDGPELKERFEKKRNKIEGKMLRAAQEGNLDQLRQLAGEFDQEMRKQADLADEISKEAKKAEEALLKNLEAERKRVANSKKYTQRRKTNRAIELFDRV